MAGPSDRSPPGRPGGYCTTNRISLCRASRKYRSREKSKIGFAQFARPYLALIPSLVLIWSIRQWMSGRVPVLGEFFMDNPLIGAPPFQGFMTAMGVIGRYLQLLVFPRTLSSDYSF